MTNRNVVVHKYHLESEHNTFELPVGTQVLTIEYQAGPNGPEVMMWVLKDTTEGLETENRQFSMYPTGIPFDVHNTSVYLGTVKLYGGTLMYHIFEHPLNPPEDIIDEPLPPEEEQNASTEE